MKIEKKHVALGTLVVGAVCFGYWLFRKKNSIKDQRPVEEEVEMETKISIEIPLPSGAAYTEDEVTNVFKAAANYFGQSKFIAISSSMATIIQSIEDSSKDKNGIVDENLVGDFMSPIIYMLDNKVTKKQHDIRIDILAFTDEIIPRIKVKRPGFDRSYADFCDLLVWEKPAPSGSFGGKPPVQAQGFMH